MEPTARSGDDRAAGVDNAASNTACDPAPDTPRTLDRERWQRLKELLADTLGRPPRERRH